MDGVAGSAAQRCKRLAMRFGMTGGQRPACKLEQQQSASKAAAGLQYSMQNTASLAPSCSPSEEVSVLFLFVLH